MDFAKALEDVSDGVIALDSEWRVSYVNSRAELLYRRKRPDLYERVWWDTFPYLAGTSAEEELRQAAKGTMTRRIKVFHPPLYAWHDKLAVPSEGGPLSDSGSVRPGADCDLVDAGPEHGIDIMNPMAQQLLGGRNLEGVTVRNALPEIEGQGLFELLDQVYSTGRPYEARELPVQYDKYGDGNLYHGLFNVTYQPLVDSTGQVYGMLSLSVEVADSGGDRQD